MYSLAFLLLGIYLWEMNENHVHIKAFMWMFIVALFTIAIPQPKCLYKWMGIQTGTSINTMEYYSSTKKNGLDICTYLDASERQYVELTKGDSEGYRLCDSICVTFLKSKNI